jgi:DNA-binding phage protein
MATPQLTQDQPIDLEAWDWMAELGRQERDRMWLARKTKVNYRAVYRYAAGESEPPLSWLMAAASVLGVTLVALPSAEGNSTL